MTNCFCLSGTRKFQGLGTFCARNGTVLGKPGCCQSTPVLQNSISVRVPTLIMNKQEVLAPRPTPTALDHHYTINSHSYFPFPHYCAVPITQPKPGLVSRSWGSWERRFSTQSSPEVPVLPQFPYSGDYFVKLKTSSQMAQKAACLALSTDYSILQSTAKKSGT